MNSCPDYRKFRISEVLTPQFSHILLLLYWPIYGILFLYFERIRDCTYHTVESPLDACIPFVPAFIIPYFFWFIYLIGMIAYTFFTDVASFKKCMWYIIITYSVTSLIYFIYPTCQNLRPDFTGNSLFSNIVSGLYVFDTNTNVCPSIHVLGSFAVCFTALKCERLNKPVVKILFTLLAILISISTVFLKQHSVIDIFAALVIAFLSYPIVFGDNKISKKLMSLI